MEFEDHFEAGFCLRKMTPEIIKKVNEQCSDKLLKKFYGIHSMELLLKEKKKLELGLRTYNKSFLYFNIFDRKGETLLGWCGYHTWYLDHNRGELGYQWFTDEAKNKGYMTQIVKWVLAYGFNEMNLNRIEAMTASYNQASKALLKKFKFEKEGLLKKHYLSNGVFEESEVYALFNDSNSK